MKRSTADEKVFLFDKTPPSNIVGSEKFGFLNEVDVDRRADGEGGGQGKRAV